MEIDKVKNDTMLVYTVHTYIEEDEHNKLFSEPEETMS